MHSYVIRMSLVCTRMSPVCHSYVLVCHPYVTHIYWYVFRMSLVCTCMSSVCHSYVLLCNRMSFVCHSYVLLRQPYVTRSTRRTRMSFVCHSFVLLCQLYVARMYSYVIRMPLVCGFTMSRVICLFVILTEDWTLFEKKGPKNFNPFYSIPFLSVIHQNKALHIFFKRGQLSIVECNIDLEYALMYSI